jgi:Skp family chaperone for outer membrane proteins
LHNALGGTVDELVAVLGISALVLASEDIKLDTEPEGGQHAEVAEAVDAAEHATRVHDRVVREAENAVEALAAAKERLETARQSGEGGEELEKLEREVERLEHEAERQRRREARARAKEENAQRERHSVTGEPARDDDET